MSVVVCFQGQTVALEDGASALIGYAQNETSKAAGFHFNNPDLAILHALISLRDGQLTIKNLSPLRQTFVNGKRVESEAVRLRLGDTLSLGPQRSATSGGYTRSISGPVTWTFSSEFIQLYPTALLSDDAVKDPLSESSMLDSLPSLEYNSSVSGASDEHSGTAEADESMVVWSDFDEAQRQLLKHSSPPTSTRKRKLSESLEILSPEEDGLDSARDVQPALNRFECNAGDETHQAFFDVNQFEVLASREYRRCCDGLSSKNDESSQLRTSLDQVTSILASSRSLIWHLWSKQCQLVKVWCLHHFSLLPSANQRESSPAPGDIWLSDQQLKSLADLCREALHRMMWEYADQGIGMQALSTRFLRSTETLMALLGRTAVDICLHHRSEIFFCLGLTLGCLVGYVLA
ncbi:hypothetical protein BCR37DRAFT_279899 [Protomyces lactucae-debilis]|uniref:FHA domain-containing protein n=1 Tax=Protomyces lactucae-debilis TaxID=2754530 RepID=A0A1Y2FIM8_PROLT|nr:uncharacterized protein BCR37DRAFT_279899 [Protomyces lactucae-debilis]ORY83783.1 hypothetical protein BCR37DRAFT_279899 [Protomyces lactucae-debilis]